MVALDVCLLFWLSGLPTVCLGIQWLVISRLGSAASSGLASRCEQLRESFTARQVRFCRQHPGFMDSVAAGAISALRECQFQFQRRRWNCSGPSAAVAAAAEPGDGGGGNGSTPQAGHRRKARKAPLAPKGTREAAFVHAISSAGVAFAVTRACSGGSISDCGCDSTAREPGRDFYWSGCSDNVDFGTTLSRTFVDAREHQITRRALQRARQGVAASDVPRRRAGGLDDLVHALVNLHNNEAGRKAIERNMRRECKCHGVSGSCELKTCWRSMPSFREVGHLLKSKFDGATEVRPHTADSRRVLLPRHAHYKPQTDADLVYVARSPSFCEPDARLGSPGTHGRRCNRTSHGVDGCELLCCNRGYQTRFAESAEMCHCKFQWCCHVHCNTCVRRMELHRCL